MQARHVMSSPVTTVDRSTSVDECLRLVLPAADRAPVTRRGASAVPGPGPGRRAVQTPCGTVPGCGWHRTANRPCGP